MQTLIPKRADSTGFRQCMLMITHACNLSCTYCYEDFKSNTHMEIPLAKDIILKELEFVNQSNNYKELEVNFMGGEPFLNFKLIKEIVEWLSDLNQEVPVFASCTTNGTLIDDSTKEWLKKHKNIFRLVLSYDGNLDMQQVNRNTEDYQIDIPFFVETWPSYSFHLTISKETISTFAQGVLDLQYAGAGLDAALAQGINWTDEDAIIYRSQLDILKEAYLQNKSLKPINLLSGELFGIMEGQDIQRKVCGTGTSMITYDVDGKTYPCHMFSPIVYGTKKALELKNSGITDGCHITDPFCKDCNFKLWCPTCYGFNYYYRGDLFCRDHRWCSMIRTQALVSCEFQISYYNKYINEITEDDMPQLKGAINTYHIIKKELSKNNIN